MRRQRTVPCLLAEFDAWRRDVDALEMALSVLSVDAADKAPVLGAAYRSDRRAALVEMLQKLKNQPAIYETVCTLYEAGSRLADDDLVRELELAKQMLERERSVSPADRAAYDRVVELSGRMWLKAKAEADFKSYAPYLEPVIEGYKAMTAGMCEASPQTGGWQRLYDRMLDLNQPGWNIARYDRFFEEIKTHVIPLLEQIMEAPPVRDDFIRKPFPADRQRQVMAKILEYIGFTPDWGKMGEAEHPLTTPICIGDVRFTTKYRECQPVQAVFSTIHESGHARHAHGLDPKYEGWLIGSSASAGLCESQSRFCENHLGRSLAFWEVMLPLFKEAFPVQLEGITPSMIYRAANAVKPSPVRTEADEVTYPLHILIRYELEKEMMDGDLRVKDLEEAWNEKYRKYLGITPANAAEGVLQDMHWPYAYFGYFPTYALGSAAAAQLFAAMQRDLDPAQLLKEHRYPELMAWLGRKVHRFGNRYPMEEIIRMAAGEDLSVKYYTDWLESKYRGIYKLK